MFYLRILQEVPDLIIKTTETDGYLNQINDHDKMLQELLFIMFLNNFCTCQFHKK